MTNQVQRPQMSLTEAIQKRTSVRAYTGQALAPEHLEMLRGIGRSAPRLTETPVRFAFVEDGERVQHVLRGIVGNYGKVKNAPALVVGITGAGPHPHESVGYAMEHLILEATRHNIGTCWNSGMFSHRHVGEVIPVEPGETVLVVSPLGYPAPAQESKLLKSLTGAKRRKPLQDIVYSGCWGEDATSLLNAKPELGRIAEAVRWAPSAMNRQPWRLILSERAVTLASVRRNGGLDSGIAMAHWAIAAHEEGIPGNWNLSVDQEGVRKALQLPAHVQPVGTYGLG